MQRIGKNIQVQLEGTKLTIEIDLAQSQGASSSGKSEIIATTSGNVALPGAEHIKLGLNLYKGR